jgi:hypothetical protein
VACIGCQSRAIVPCRPAAGGSGRGDRLGRCVGPGADRTAHRSHQLPRRLRQLRARRLAAEPRRIHATGQRAAAVINKAFLKIYHLLTSLQAKIPTNDFLSGLVDLRGVLNSVGAGAVAISCDEWGLGPPWVVTQFNVRTNTCELNPV